MSNHRVNRGIELLAGDQPIYYSGGHTGALLTHEQGVQDARTWADYINVRVVSGGREQIARIGRAHTGRTLPVG